jgi:hypothetical protein
VVALSRVSLNARPAATSPSPNTFEMVRLACTKCERRGQYRKSTLIERYGSDQNMIALRLVLTAPLPKVAANKITDLCGVIYPNRRGK